MVKKIFMSILLSITLVTTPSMAWAENLNSAPEKPDVDNIEDVDEANELIDNYNNEVSQYNQQLENNYVESVNEINNYNAEVDQYNQQIDENYNDTVQEINTTNQEIEAHNAAEEERVARETAENEKAEQEAYVRNQEIDEENAIEENRINQVNEERQQKYNEDYAQYEKDKEFETRILNAGYESVEQYNEVVTNYNNKVDTYNSQVTEYHTKLNITNEIAAGSPEKNSSIAPVTIEQTYVIQKGAETGRKIPVHIEHNFLGTNISYSQDFEIDAADIITFKGIAAIVEVPLEGYCYFYYNTDNSHSLGLWSNSNSYLANNPTAMVEQDWINGDVHIITYKDSTNEYQWNFEDITMIYNYSWIQLYKIKDHYNYANIPNEPVLELEDFIPIPYVEAQLIDIVPADIWELLSIPEKEAYLTYKDFPALPIYLDYMPYIIPSFEEDSGEGFNTLPQPQNFVVLANFNEETVSDYQQPRFFGSSVEENKTPSIKPNISTISEERNPLTSNNNDEKQSWALLNLILMLLTILILIKLPKKDNDEYYYKHHNNILGVLLAIAAVITFILTENIWLPMVFVDSWTILMAIICGCGIISKILTKTTKEEKNLTE